MYLTPTHVATKKMHTKDVDASFLLRYSFDMDNANSRFLSAYARLSAAGLKDANIAARIGVHRTTLYRWVRPPDAIPEDKVLALEALAERAESL